MGGASTKVKEAYQLREGTEEVYWDRRWLKKIPAHTFQYHSLNKISLAHNSLNNLTPEIAQLCNLTELILCDNLIKQLPSEFSTLTKLKLLDLSDNMFQTIPVSILQSIGNLQTLNMNNNKLTVLPPDFPQLTQLNSLSLKSNKLESIPNQITQLQTLFILDISFNSLCTLPKSFKHLYSLRMLQLSQNNLSRISSFRGLTNLVHLDVSGNRLSSIPPKMSLIIDTSTSPNHKDELSIGKLRVLNVRENKDLLELPQEILNLRPPLMIYTTIPSEVVPHVFLGGLDAALNLGLLQHWNITHIILAIADMSPHFPKNFVYHLLSDAKDAPSCDLSVHFEQCCKFIEQGLEGGNVLIHCRAGISRSATITIAYVMRKHKLRFEEALRFVSNKRHQIEPNIGFREQLMRYEVYLFDICKIGDANTRSATSTPKQTTAAAGSKGLSNGNGLDEIIFSPPIGGLENDLAVDESAGTRSHNSVEFSNIGELE